MDPSPGDRRYETLVVQPYGEPGDYHAATVVRVCPTVADAYRYIDECILTMAKHGLPHDTVELVVVDPERRLIARPAETLQ
jgi:hypothetical protein